MKPARASASQGGFTLIEALVALLLLSVGLLGIGALHARAVQFSVDAEDRNRAAVLANEIASQMWSTGSVSLSTTVEDAWKAKVSSATTSGLPNGAGEVTVASGVATIEITWRPPSRKSADGTFKYVTKVALP